MGAYRLPRVRVRMASCAELANASRDRVLRERGALAGPTAQRQPRAHTRQLRCPTRSRPPWARRCRRMEARPRTHHHPACPRLFQHVRLCPRPRSGSCACRPVRAAPDARGTRVLRCGHACVLTRILRGRCGAHRSTSSDSELAAAARSLAESVVPSASMAPRMQHLATVHSGGQAI